MSTARQACSSTRSRTASQSVAGFACLHSRSPLLVALMAQYTSGTPDPALDRSGSTSSLTVVATLYFGWHYIADDIAGIADRADRVLPRRHRHRAEVRTHGLRRTRRPPPRPVDADADDPRTVVATKALRAAERDRRSANYMLVVRQADTPGTV